MPSVNDILQQTSVERSAINKDDIMQLLNTAIESGEPFAIDFAKKIAGPLAEKIDQRTFTSELKIDGEGIGKHLTNTIIAQSSEAALRAADNISTSLDNAIAPVARFDVFNGLGLDQMSNVFSEDTSSTQTQWNSVVTDIMSSAQEGFAEAIGEASSDLSNLFNTSDSSSLTTAISESTTDMITSIKGMTDDIQDFSIKDLLADTGDKVKWLDDKINPTEPPPLPDNVSRLALDSDDDVGTQGGPGFDSILDEDPTVVVSDFGDVALDKIENLLSGLGDDLPSKRASSKGDHDDKDWDYQRGSKLLPGGWLSNLLTGGMIATVAGIFSDGPEKGFIKLFGGIGRKIVGSVFRHGKDGRIGQVLIKKFGGKIAGALGKIGLKNIPVIGTLVNLAYATSRFKRGDVIGGTIDLLSGLVDFIPAAGIPLSIGLDTLNALLDIKYGGSKGAAGAKKMDFFKTVGGAVWSKLQPIMRHLPVFGTALHLSEAVGHFSGGGVSSGIKSLMRAVSSVAPFGVLGFDLLLDLVETKAEKYNESKGNSGGGILTAMKSLKDSLMEKFKSTSVYKFAMGIGKFAKGNISAGLKAIAEFLGGSAGGFMSGIAEWFETPTEPMSGKSTPPVNVGYMLQSAKSQKEAEIQKAWNAADIEFNEEDYNWSQLNETSPIEEKRQRLKRERAARDVSLIEASKEPFKPYSTTDGQAVNLTSGDKTNEDLIKEYEKQASMMERYFQENQSSTRKATERAEALMQKIAEQDKFGGADNSSVITPIPDVESVIRDPAWELRGSYWSKARR
jgi:hypothetical protein